MSEFLPVADLLKILFEEVQHPSGRPFTMQEVSDATGVSLATISQMKTGKIKNPQLNTLRELCRFFKVPLRFFESQSVETCYALLQEKPEASTREISEIAFRATTLSPEAQQDILTIIKWVQSAEQAYKAGKGDLPSLPRLTKFEDQETDQ
jgi:transcriptional regulator with XRE-family HTH domain